jgi:hypothetical protein
MTAYNFTHSITISPEVAERRAARKKVIEKARKLERDSYLAMMRKKRRLQVTSDLL